MDELAQIAHPFGVYESRQQQAPCLLEIGQELPGSTKIAGVAKADIRRYQQAYDVFGIGPLGDVTFVNCLPGDLGECVDDFAQASCPDLVDSADCFEQMQSGAGRVIAQLQDRHQVGEIDKGLQPRELV